MSDFISHQLKWLESQAPRYTSYPSALYFKSLTPEIHQGWLQELDPGQSVALYIHIPFCSQLCWFCGCHTKVVNGYDSIAEYVGSLIKEMEILETFIPHRIKLHSIHFGGGSPTLLNVEDMEAIFAAIYKIFDKKDDCEVAIEIDPRRITKEKIQSYKRLGFNRASLGVQDTDERVQIAINRFQPFDTVLQCCEMLKEEGITAINVDLIYGLPFQHEKSIEKTINQVVSLATSRIAYYSFAHVPWVKKHQRLIFEKDLPNTKDKGKMYVRASKILEENGYETLGIDHFARPEDDCFKGFHQRKLRRNFMGYTAYSNDFIIGIGASSVSNLGRGLSQNKVSFSEYKQAIDQGVLPTARGWCYEAEDYLRKAIISELMCYFSVDLEKILRDFNYPVDYLDEDLEKLSEFKEAGVISIADRRIEFLSPLRMIVRSVCAVFDPFLLNGGKCSKVA